MRERKKTWELIIDEMKKIKPKSQVKTFFIKTRRGDIDTKEIQTR
jgi:hypothetical protein